MAHTHAHISEESTNKIYINKTEILRCAQWKLKQLVWNEVVKSIYILGGRLESSRRGATFADGPRVAGVLCGLVILNFAKNFADKSVDKIDIQLCISYRKGEQTDKIKQHNYGELNAHKNP